MFVTDQNINDTQEGTKTAPVLMRAPENTWRPTQRVTNPVADGRIGIAVVCTNDIVECF